MLLKHLYPGYKYPATKMARLAIVVVSRIGAVQQRNARVDG